QETATGVTIELPGLPWLHLAGGANIGDIAGGETKTIGLLVNPPNDALLGHYVGSILVDYNSSQESSAHFDFNVKPEVTGALHIDVEDELTFFTQGSQPLVHGATVRLFDAKSGVLVARETASGGSLDLPDLAAGAYRLQITATDHVSYNSSLQIDGGATTSLEAFLPVDGVKYSWSVEETTLEDRYHIVLDSTFETDVPVPVVTMDPPVLEYAELQPGQKKIIDLTITNHGFIQVDQISLDFPDPTGFVITPLIDHIDVLAAKSSQVVPVTIERLPINSPPPPDPSPDGPPSLPFDPTVCDDSGHSCAVAKYHYECGSDGVWRQVFEGYDGPDNSNLPCLP